MEKVCKMILENALSGSISEKEAYEAIKALKHKAEGQDDIAIIGVSVNLPLSKNSEEFWNIVRNKVDCVREIPQNRRMDSDDLLKCKKVDADSVEYLKLAYLDEIDKFDSNFFRISPKEAGLMDPNQRLFLQTAWGAIEDAGYGGTRIIGTKTGVYIGYGGESDYGRVIMEVQPEAYSIAVTGNISPIIASRISYILDLKGPSIVMNTACSSSLIAVHYACQGIRNKECDMAIAGGVKINLMPVQTNQKIGIESSDARTKAFDDSSDGTGGGEGVAAILLKPLKKALADRDTIYAVIKGSSANQDGSSNGITAPNPMAQAEVLKAAWKNAGVDPETIAYIEAHGTGTKLGDPIEIDGIQKAFTDYTAKRQFCAISSVKTNIGHLDSAAGIVGLVKAALALKNREIPPSLHFEKPNRVIDFINSPVYVNDTARKWGNEKLPRRCGVSSFGLSGTNCHIVLEEAPAAKNDESPESGKLNVLTISAKTKESFDELVDIYKKKYMNGIDGQELRNLCYTLNTGRGHYNFRAAIILKQEESLLEKLERIGQTDDGTGSGSGIFYGEHRVSAAENNVKAGVEISETERAGYNKKANSLVARFINAGKQDKGVLYDICALYVNGADIDWDEIYRNEKNRRVNAPTYPFMRQRCWLNLPSSLGRSGESNMDNLYYCLNWEQKELKSKTSNILNKNILVFIDESRSSSDFISMLESKAITLIKVVKGKEFKKVDEFNYIIGGSQSDYVTLCTNIKQFGINMVIHLLSILQNREIENLKELYERQNLGVLSLLYFAKAIQEDLKNKIDVVLISDNVNEVTGSECRTNPENAVLFGLGKTIGMENPNISCRLIDIDENMDSGRLIEELESDEKDYQVAYRNGIRYVDTIKKVDTDSLDKTEIKIKSDGVYIITGGTGRLGIEVSKYLASKGKVNLALINRSAMPDENRWDEIIEKQTSDKLSYAIKSVNELRARGANVECYSVDITSEKDLGAFLADLRSKHGKINGIIHCAAVGVGRDGIPINEETEESFREVLLPKVEGTWLLDKLTQSDSMDFFIMYSSAITTSGGIGTGSYTAANSYLDSYAMMRNKTGRKTLAINWPVLENKDLKGNMDEGKLMFKVLSIDCAMTSLGEILGKNISRVIIGELNVSSDILSIEGHLPFRLSDELKDSIQKDKLKLKPINISLTGREKGDYTNIERMLGTVFGEVLGLTEVSIYDNFFELGGNSIMAVKAEVEMEKKGIRASVSTLYAHPTISELAADISEKNTFNKKALPDIEPFNEIFYRSCFYNSLFPVIRHFGGNEITFLINDIIVYKLDDTGISADYAACRQADEIFELQGIAVNSKDRSDNIINDIKNAISQNRPVIIWIDCFYESIRTDVYGKSHWPHTLLIYGYDEDEEVFNIIEHRHRDNLSYEKRIISFKDVLNCYKGLQANFPESTGPTFYEFSLNDTGNREKKNRRKFATDFKSNMLEKQADIYAGISHLQKFMQNFDLITSKKETFFEKGEGLIAMFNSIINAKQVERYRLISLFENEPNDFIHLLDKIIEEWSYIRQIISKSVFSGIFDAQKINNLLNKFEEIRLYELEYHKRVFQFLEKIDLV